MSKSPVADYIERLIRKGEKIPPGRYVVERTIILRDGDRVVGASS